MIRIILVIIVAAILLASPLLYNTAIDAMQPDRCNNALTAHRQVDYNDKVTFEQEDGRTVQGYLVGFPEDRVSLSTINYLVKQKNGDTIRSRPMPQNYPYPDIPSHKTLYLPENTYLIVSVPDRPYQLWQVSPQQICAVHKDEALPQRFEE